MHTSSRWSEAGWHSAGVRVEDVESPAPYVSEELESRSPSPPVSPGHDLPPGIIGPDGQEWVRERWRGEAEGGKGEEAGRRDGGEEDDAGGGAGAHGPEDAGPLEQHVEVDQPTKTAGGETTSRRPVDIFFSTYTHTHTHTHTHLTVVTYIIDCAIVLFSIAAIFESN